MMTVGTLESVDPSGSDQLRNNQISGTEMSAVFLNLILRTLGQSSGPDITKR
jgi:hypothetical protein